MAVYNVLNEVDYYPRSKHSPELNPTYGDRKVVINEALEYVALAAPSSLTAREWIGNAMMWLDRPLASEDELFAQANEELERLRRARS